jgi:hypothetical protein
MGTRFRCSCPRCTLRGLMGPAVIITIGLLLLLQETGRGSAFHMNNTYPVILIVMGAILLASALAPMTGHVYAPLPPGAPPYVPPPPGSHPPAPPSSSSGQGG